MTTQDGIHTCIHNKTQTDIHTQTHTHTQYMIMSKYKKYTTKIKR